MPYLITEKIAFQNGIREIMIDLIILFFILIKKDCLMTNFIEMSINGEKVSFNADADIFTHKGNQSHKKILEFGEEFLGDVIKTNSSLDKITDLKHVTLIIGIPTTDIEKSTAWIEKNLPFIKLFIDKSENKEIRDILGSRYFVE